MRVCRRSSSSATSSSCSSAMSSSAVGRRLSAWRGRARSSRSRVGGRHADVGEQQRLLELVPRLVVDAALAPQPGERGRGSCPAGPGVEAGRSPPRAHLRLRGARFRDRVLGAGRLDGRTRKGCRRGDRACRRALAGGAVDVVGALARDGTDRAPSATNRIASTKMRMKPSVASMAGGLRSVRGRGQRSYADGSAMPAASSAALMRARSSRSTRHCSWGCVRTTTRITTRPGASDSTPRTLGSARMTDAILGFVPDPGRRRRGSRRWPRPCRPRTRRVRRPPRATTAATCCRRAGWSPLGMCHTTPSMSRRRVVRRLTPSTVPVADTGVDHVAHAELVLDEHEHAGEEVAHQRLRAEAQRDADDPGARDERCRG